jgi:hypothetical protein
VGVYFALTGIVDKQSVNHSAHEFVRSCVVLKDTATRQMRAAMASTQMIDRVWGIMKGDRRVVHELWFGRFREEGF